ncbi:MAG: hypothetical protein ACETWR_16570 [Anaerolineae bacterium]
MSFSVSRFYPRQGAKDETTVCRYLTPIVAAGRVCSNRCADTNYCLKSNGHAYNTSRVCINPDVHIDTAAHAHINIDTHSTYTITHTYSNTDRNICTNGYANYNAN